MAKRTKRGIYSHIDHRGREILYWMEHSDAKFRNQTLLNLGSSSENAYIHITDALPVGGSKQRCKKTGLSVKLLHGKNGQAYKLFVGDYSVLPISDDEHMAML